MAQRVEVAPRLVISGTSDRRVYWAEPDNFIYRGTFEFTLWRDVALAGVDIPRAGSSPKPQVPEQARWIANTFPGVAPKNPTRWTFPLDAAAVIEQKLLSLGRLHAWEIRTDNPNLVPDVFPARPVDADREEFEWRLRALPQTDPAVVEEGLLLILRPHAWCAVYDRSAEGPQPSAWFRDVTRGGIGQAAFRLDREGRPLDGVKLNAAQLHRLLEEASNLPEDDLRSFRAEWVF